MSAPAVINPETGEVRDLDAAAAESRAQQIEARLTNIQENFDRAIEKLRDSIERLDHFALGYRSAGHYISERYAGALSGLPPSLRQAAVGELTHAGMSVRAIGAALDVGVGTVHRDQQQLAGVPDGTPAPQTPAPEPDGEAGRARATTPQGGDATASEPGLPSGSDAPRPAVTGIDGKQYSRPEPTPAESKPRAHPADVEYAEQDRAEELSANLASHIALLYALTNPERRAEYIDAWPIGTKSDPPFGDMFVTPKHMRELSDALATFADEWERANV